MSMTRAEQWAVRKINLQEMSKERLVDECIKMEEGLVQNAKTSIELQYELQEAEESIKVLEKKIKGQKNQIDLLTFEIMDLTREKMTNLKHKEIIEEITFERNYLFEYEGGKEIHTLDMESALVEAYKKANGKPLTMHRLCKKWVINNE